MRKNYDVFVEKTMEKIFEVFVEYRKGNITIEEFLLKRFNIVFEEAYLNHLDDWMTFNSYQFLTELHFDLFHEAEVIRDLIK